MAVPLARSRSFQSARPQGRRRRWIIWGGMATIAASVGLLAVAISTGRTPVQWVSEVVTGNVSPPATRATIDPGPVRLTSLAIGGAPRLGAADRLIFRPRELRPVEVAMDSDPVIWIPPRERRHSFTPMSRDHSSWYQKYKHQVWPQLEIRWMQFSSSDPRGEEQAGSFNSRMRRSDDGSMRVVGVLEAPLRPGTYELQVRLKEVPAHGDDADMWCQIHVIHAELVDVAGEPWTSPPLTNRR